MRLKDNPTFTLVIFIVFKIWHSLKIQELDWLNKLGHVYISMQQTINYTDIKKWCCIRKPKMLLEYIHDIQLNKKIRF